MRICASCAFAHRIRICALCAYCALLRICRILDLKERKERFACTRGRAHRGKAPRDCISLRILDGEGESTKRHCISSTGEGKMCSMKVAKCTPATRFRRAHQKFSRPRAASQPLMQNAVTLAVLEHGRPCQNPIPAVRVDVRNLIKP